MGIGSARALTPQRRGLAQQRKHSRLDHIDRMASAAAVLVVGGVARIVPAHQPGADQIGNRAHGERLALARFVHGRRGGAREREPQRARDLVRGHAVERRLLLVEAEIEPLVLSDDRNFRPVDMEFGPDGALYLVDWYNRIISHNEVPREHPDRDRVRGRIWRVRHRDQYPRWRNALAITTGFCLFIRFIRVSPPRLTPGHGFWDLSAQMGRDIYGPVGTGASDQFAAMPSIHVAWATIVAFGIWHCADSRWRVIGPLHLAGATPSLLLPWSACWLSCLPEVLRWCGC